jgi:hypothetical protein
MNITTNQDFYRPGDSVEGELAIFSNDEFNYNAIHLTFAGREHTRIVVSHGKTSSVYTDERVYFSQRIDVENEGQMSIEGMQFPFHFVFPDNIPSSYEGTNGWIEYTLTAIIERSWARDPKKQVALAVKNFETMPPSEFLQDYIENDGHSILDVELEKDTVPLGSVVALRFRVAQDVKIRGVRIELQAEEEAKTEHYNRAHTYTLAKKYLEESTFDRDLWVDVSINTDENMPSYFSREILSNMTSIKATLDIPRARDKSLLIPIKLGHYILTTESDAKQYDDFTWNS